MPIYEYQCESCGRRTETLQRMSDPPLATCPFCQSGPMKRLVSAPAFHLKGSGWYVTDYARKDGADKTDGSGADKAGSDKGGDKAGGDKAGGDKAGAEKAEKASEAKPKETASSGDKTSTAASGGG